MEGRSQIQVASLLADTPLGELRDHGDTIRSLIEHPGWALVDGLMDRAHSNGTRRLIDAKSPLEQAEYAQDCGFLRGLAFAQDVVATLLAKAEYAQQKLNEDAESAAREATG